MKGYTVTLYVRSPGGTVELAEEKRSFVAADDQAAVLDAKCWGSTSVAHSHWILADGLRQVWDSNDQADMPNLPLRSCGPVATPKATGRPTSNLKFKS